MISSGKIKIINQTLNFDSNGVYQENNDDVECSICKKVIDGSAFEISGDRNKLCIIEYVCASCFWTFIKPKKIWEM